MMLARKNEKNTRGCLIPILALLGFMLVCFVFCYALYFLNIPFQSPSGATTEGGYALPLLPTIY